MSYDYAIHSDYLVHWTGKDLDYIYDSEWYENDKSKTSEPLTEEYLRRLYTILKHGLWLTSEAEQEWQVGGKNILVPGTPKTCFTELKLSQSRRHARQYGRLGIGVKRPYVFTRCGRPLAYFGFRQNAQHDRFLAACAAELGDANMLNFFKPMNSGRDLNYDWYSESEWRIIFLQELLDRKLLIDPRDVRNEDAHRYFKSLSTTEQEKLKYLAPLDSWFTLIIYPSIDVKNAAQQHTEHGIQEEIRIMKTNPYDHANRVERGNWPVEVNLDACRNF